MARKRGAAGTGSIRKKTRTNPSGRTYTYWEGRYSTGFHPETGKQVQKSITGKTQKEVSQKLRAILASIHAPSVISQGSRYVAVSMAARMVLSF